MRKFILFFVLCITALVVNAQSPAEGSYSGSMLNTIKFEGAINGTDLQVVSFAKYTNSGKTVQVSAGSSVDVVISSLVMGGENYLNNLHSYLYIDTDRNGFNATLSDINTTNGKPSGDLVGYSYLSVDGVGEFSHQGKITAGTTVSVNLSNVVMPATGGVFPARLKIDKDNVDPNMLGAQSEERPGRIVDFYIEVVTTTATVKYIYKYNGTEIASSTHSAVIGGDYPDPLASPRYGFAPVNSSVAAGTVSGDETVVVDCKETSSFCFNYGSSLNDADKWYFIQVNGKYLKANGNVCTAEQNLPTNNLDAYSWKFVGDRANGFAIVNMANNDYELTLSGAKSWVVYENNSTTDKAYRLKSSAGFISYGTSLTTTNNNTASESVVFTERVISETYKPGYYRISHNGIYLQSNTMFFGGATGANSIFYYSGNALVSYSEGRFVTASGNNVTLAEVGTQANTVTFTTANDENEYIMIGGSYLHVNTSNMQPCTNRDHTTSHKFNVESVSALPVTISGAKYASFYAPVPVKIPAGVTAYYIENSGAHESYVVLTEITSGNVIPANFGVILSGNAGTYNFEISGVATASVGSNLLEGTVEATRIYSDDYVLNIMNGEVGLYLTSEYEVTKYQYFTNGSHKAYLPAAAVASVAANSIGFTFDFSGTTGIDAVEGENNGEVVIYDLSGRRVENPTRGIYIVNGKRVFIK